MLSKTLTGQRVLPYDVLDELIYHLRATPVEEQRLRLYYEAQFEKEGIRRAREMIAKLFLDLTELDFTPPVFEESRLLLDVEHYAGSRSVFSGPTNVQPLLRMVISQELMREQAGLELILPPRDTFLVSELLRRYLDGRMNAEVSQIMAFDASASEKDVNLHNLQIFCRIFPICLLSRRNYHPYYYYDNSIAARYTDPFPYFLITHSCVVCLSGDGNQAMLLQGEDQVGCYHRHFQTLLARCHDLIQYITDPVEILASYDRCTDEDGFYMVMDQPCFGRFYEDTLINQYLYGHLPFYERLADVAHKRFARLRASDQFYTLFSQSGLKRFAQSGALDDFPTAFVRPFAPEQRRKLLTALAHHIRSGDVTGRLLRPEIFPDYLSITTSKHSGVGFFTTAQFPLQTGICSVQIKEPDLCRAFHNWLTYLPGSEQTLGIEETAHALEELAQQIESDI